ncbi:hypothetical protein C8F01DRAFT_1242793 [Mycena amicta]|nr:hypothetical protein C8F01DRAFT_1242793 [Mycena amicta]
MIRCHPNHTPKENASRSEFSSDPSDALMFFQVCSTGQDATQYLLCIHCRALLEKLRQHVPLATSTQARSDQPPSFSAFGSAGLDESWIVGVKTTLESRFLISVS